MQNTAAYMGFPPYIQSQHHSNRETGMAMYKLLYDLKFLLSSICKNFRAFLKFRIKRELQRLNPINLIPSDSQDLNLLNLILMLTLPTVEDKS